MKQLTALLLCLLLCGCTRRSPAAVSEPVPDPAADTIAAGLYEAEHPIEKAYPGLARAYSLPLQAVQDIRAVGKDVLVLSGEDSTTLTLFTGEELRKNASLTLDFPLGPEDPSLQIQENRISFFDPIRKETLVLDHSLQEIRRITVPDNLSGKPLFDSGRNILYYCTDWSVMAWDLETGIRRTVKELSQAHQALTGLYMDGQILECSILHNGQTDKHLLSADQGLDLKTLPENTDLHYNGSLYFAALPGGYQTLLIFGAPGGTPQLLLPENPWQQAYYLPQDHAAVTVSISEDGTLLDYYELHTGLLRTSMNLYSQQTPKAIINTADHALYILTRDPQRDQDLLYRWDPLRQSPDPSNVTCRKTDYHSPEDPDQEALAECAEYAAAIGEKYGIHVRVWEDATAVEPWDYRFEPEYLAPVLQKELELLDQRLARYPKKILQQTKNHFGNLHICLVRQIIGTEAPGSLQSATGIQFFANKDAYVVITTGKYSEQALYHELYHAMETHILTATSALDPWASLNPADFVYGDNQPNPDIYLQGQTRAFVDRYSMSALKEDRARVLENAMLSGKQHLFQSEYMQRKLAALCIGIREAYGLEKHPESLPWEQYLVNALIPRT